MTMKKLLLMLALVAFAVPAMAAQIVTLEWTAPTTRMDGTAFDPSTELDHYDFACGDTQGGVYDGPTTEIATGTTYELTAGTFFPSYGDYYCVLTATDVGGLESGFSNEVLIEYTAAPPSAPNGVTIQITIE